MTNENPWVPTPEEAALEERLRALPPPVPRPGCGPDLRRDFCAGFPVGGAESGSRGSDAPRRPYQVTTNAEQEMERLLWTSAPAPPASGGYRDALRRRFVHGLFDDATPTTPAPEPVLAFHRRPLFRLLVGGLAAAALILVIARLVPRTERWRAVEVVGETITLDGRTVRVVDLAEIGPAIMDAGLVETGAGTHVRLELADRMHLEVRPDTRFRPQDLGHPVAGSPSRLELEEGEVFLWKNPDGGDGTITVATFDVDVAVVGTIVGVMCSEGATCVCVERGDATVSCCEMSVPPGHSHVTRPGHPCEDHLFPPGCDACPADGPEHNHACRLLHFADGL